MTGLKVTGSSRRYGDAFRRWVCFDCWTRKDLIISGGLNIYPKEIEDVLNDQDGVIKSAVVGVPHRFWRGYCRVWSGSQLDANALQAVCRENLAGFKLPRRWIQLDALPRNTMGKVQEEFVEG